MSLDDATPDAYKVEFTVPGFPTAKGRPRFKNVTKRDGTRFQSVYTPKVTRDYERAVAAAARAAMGRLNPTAEAVTLMMVAFIPIPASWPKQKRACAAAGLVLPTSRPDLDNYEKAITDALNGVCYEDDSQICDVIKSKRYSTNPRVHVSVHPMEGFTVDWLYVPKAVTAKLKRERLNQAKGVTKP
jgi:Holliday junction resolvase RusA-like endonuclease